MITMIYLIRHSVKMLIPLEYDRIQPLTVTGEERARHLLDIKELRRADAAYCSPFARTISTLRYLIEADDVPLTLDDRLRELDFGGPPPALPKGTAPEMKPPVPDFHIKQWADRDLRRDDGESLNQCSARIAEVLSEIVQHHAGGKVLVGSHGGAVCAYLSSMMDGIDSEYAMTLPMPAVFRLHFEGANVSEIKRLL